jgi:HlyD family secretion protein
MSNHLFSKAAGLRNPLSVAALTAFVIATVAGITVSRSFLKADAISESSEVQSPSVKVNAVGASGRLEPRGETIRVSAPISQEGVRVEELLVKRGDRVQPDQTIAVLDNYDRQNAALLQAKRQVDIADAQLAQVKAGAKTGAIQAKASTIERIKSELEGESAAQAAAIARLESELNNAELEQRRYQQLYEDGAVSASERDSKLLTLETAQKQVTEARVNRTKAIKTLQDQLAEATAMLDEVSEVRPIDVQVAQAELNSAKAAVREAEANLARTYVRAPKASQILQIYAYPGEAVGTDGVVSLGETEQMYAVAEVYETDITHVKVGQRVRITSQGFNGTLQGTVDEVGLQIAKKDVLNTDPAADVDARVVEVRIRLDTEDSQKVAGLTNLQIDTVIDITP